MEASNDGRLGRLGVLGRLGGLGWLCRSRRLGRLDGQGHWGGEGEHQGTPEGLSAPEVSVSRAMHSGVAGVSAPVSVAAVQIGVDKDSHRGTRRAVHQANEVGQDNPLGELDGKMKHTIAVGQDSCHRRGSGTEPSLGWTDGQQCLKWRPN
jgi:hypothetical protein